MCKDTHDKEGGGGKKSSPKNSIDWLSCSFFHLRRYVCEIHWAMWSRGSLDSGNVVIAASVLWLDEKVKWFNQCTDAFDKGGNIVFTTIFTTSEIYSVNFVRYTLTNLGGSNYFQLHDWTAKQQMYPLCLITSQNRPTFLESPLQLPSSRYCWICTKILHFRWLLQIRGANTLLR